MLPLEHAGGRGDRLVHQDLHAVLVQHPSLITIPGLLQPVSLTGQHAHADAQQLKFLQSTRSPLMLNNSTSTCAPMAWSRWTTCCSGHCSGTKRSWTPTPCCTTPTSLMWSCMPPALNGISQCHKLRQLARVVMWQPELHSRAGRSYTPPGWGGARANPRVVHFPCGCKNL